MTETTTTPTSDVLERIRKLLALATSSNEHEAALALARAQALLRKHDLAVADIERLTGTPKATVGAQRERRTTTHLWEGHLVQAVATANRCRILRDRETFHIIGREANVEATRLAFRWISQQLLRAHSEAVLRGVIDGGVTARVQFLEGAVSRVGVRLREAQREAERSEEGVTALVLVRDREVNDYVRTAYPNARTTYARHHRNGDRQAREAGYAAGASVSLAAQGSLNAPRTALKQGRG